jgi:hypothetical protein
MSFIELITRAGGSAAIEQIAARVGISPEQARIAAAALAPAIAGGFQQKAQAGDLSGLVAGLGSGGDPLAQGNDVLGEIFGSKDVSRAVAADAATKTGIGVDQLKLLLPLLASLAAGSVASKAGSNGGLEGLIGLLDRDGDGNPLNDLAGLAGKFFNR